MFDLDSFPNLEQLILDYNSIKSVNSIPFNKNLKVLSLSYNQIGNEQETLQILAERCPSLEHLNLMKNPCNPVFSNQTNYQNFRAKFAIWIPSLKTLDGTDFKDDQEAI